MSLAAPRIASAQHTFSQVPSVTIQRSVFDRSCGLKTTFNEGDLIPIFVDEALPGDTLELGASVFGRVQTLLYPVMENMYLDFFFFAIPNRLLWDNWQKFNGEQTNPGDSTTFLVPYVTPPGGGFTSLSLADYFGINLNAAWTSLTGPCALWFRGYNLVWNEWFRDENLQNSVTKNMGDGPDTSTNYAIQKRGKRHDYFSASLPWPQKTTAVSVPIGTITRVSNAAAWKAYNSGTDTLAANSAVTITSNNLRGAADLSLDPVGGLTVSPTTINALRDAFSIQRMYEKDARGGTRYTEILRSHFGVVSPDARLQRPEYIGGGSTRINVNPVAVTNSTSAIMPADLAAFGTTSGGGIGFRKSFVEHSIVLGLVNFRADLSYQQGTERMWFRRSRFDFYWPELAGLGEQSVLNREIYQDGSANDLTVWGYQERYAEYRYKPSRVTGLMRSNNVNGGAGASSLDIWHLTQSFGALPVLNASFIADAPPVSRITAVTTPPTGRGPVWQQHFMLDCWFNYRCTRPMPVYGIPGGVARF